MLQDTLPQNSDHQRGVLQMFVDYSAHQPQPARPMVRADGLCSPRTLGEAQWVDHCLRSPPVLRFQVWEDLDSVCTSSAHLSM